MGNENFTTMEQNRWTPMEVNMVRKHNCLQKHKIESLSAKVKVNMAIINSKITIATESF